MLQLLLLRLARLLVPLRGVDGGLRERLRLLDAEDELVAPSPLAVKLGVPRRELGRERGDLRLERALRGSP